MAEPKYPDGPASNIDGSTLLNHDQESISDQSPVQPRSEDILCDEGEKSDRMGFIRKVYGILSV